MRASYSIHGRLAIFLFLRLGSYREWRVCVGCGHAAQLWYPQVDKLGLIIVRLGYRQESRDEWKRIGRCSELTTGAFRIHEHVTQGIPFLLVLLKERALFSLSTKGVPVCT